MKRMKQIQTEKINYFCKMVNMSPYNEITYAINGAAMEVHSKLGCGFQEVIYQRALSIELDWRGIKHNREQELPVWYKGIDIGTRRVDFLIDVNLIVEIKALSKLEDVHLAQTLNYLKIFNLDVALLINFGAVQLEYRRLIKPKS